MDESLSLIYLFLLLRQHIENIGLETETSQIEEELEFNRD